MSVPDHELAAPALEIAQAFHEAYERLAPQFHYETRTLSRVPWDQVPIENRGLMVATALELLQEGTIASRRATMMTARVVLKADLWDALMDEDDRGGESRVEALRRTAHSAAQDWQEAIAGVG